MTLPPALPGTGRVAIGLGEAVLNASAIDYFTGGRLPET